MRSWLKTLREKEGLSQQIVAKSLGISKQYYQMIEAGIRAKDLDTSIIMGLSAVFNVSAVEILKFEQDYQNSKSTSTTHTA